MKLALQPILSLALALVSSGSIARLHAQQASVGPESEIAHCVRWMNTTVPMKPFGSLDAAEFCAGVQRNGLGGWWSIFECGPSEQQLTGTTARYCVSSGHIDANETWAAGFRSMTRDGHELLNESPEAKKDSPPAAATFYTRTGLSMGDLKLAAGMYDLIPTKSPKGWTLEVAKWSDVPNPQSYVGSVEMRRGPRRDFSEHSNLGISANAWANGCSALSPDESQGELHFAYGSTDLFVCIRPDERRVHAQQQVSALQ
jgi:hypothetical protein